MPIEAIKSTSDAVIPPCTYLKEKFDGLGHHPPSESECDDIAKAVLLLPEQVSLWFEHLHTVQENRKRGAARAAATRRKNRQEKGQEKRREKGRKRARKRKDKRARKRKDKRARKRKDKRVRTRWKLRNSLRLTQRMNAIWLQTTNKVKGVR